MSSLPPILVVAATAHELAPPDGWLAVACGVGPVEAAAATAAAIAEHRPAAVLHVGIAGARRRSALAPGTVVIGREARYCDLVGVPEAWAPSVIPAAPALLVAACHALPDAPVLPIGTSARVGGTLRHASGCAVEAMEGFGVLRAAQRAGVPALEVRAVSNAIEEADRGRWQLARGFAAIVAVTPTLVAELRACVR